MKKYTESSDKKFAEDIIKGAPEAGKAWINFDQSTLARESAIPLKYKELIAIAVALTTQCPYCLEKHTAKAVELGASREEIAETIMITAALRSGAAFGYGLLTMKFFKNEERDGF